MYSKPSFQINLFRNMEVEDPQYETKIRCPDQTKYNIRTDSITVRESKGNKNFLVIQRPINGYLKLKIFCYFCEKYYRLKIHSKDNSFRKRRFNLIIYGIIGVFFWFITFQIIQYIGWIFIFIKMIGNLKDNFVEASNRHEARIIRKWKPTEIEQSD